MSPGDDVSRVPFSSEETRGVYRAIHERRDVRSTFCGGEISDDQLWRLLEAAHHAPSVGFMQPWRFLIVRSPVLRDKIRDLVEIERERTSEALGDRGDEFLRLKIEGIRECAAIVVVSLVPDRERFVFGRRTLPELDVASTGCAIQNLWLAARAEGLGMGWVSIFDPDALGRLIHSPAGSRPIAVLCLGPVSAFESVPELEQAGWDHRRVLESIVDVDVWGETLSGVETDPVVCQGRRTSFENRHQTKNQPRSE